MLNYYNKTPGFRVNSVSQVPVLIAPLLLVLISVSLVPILGWYCSGRVH